MGKLFKKFRLKRIKEKSKAKEMPQTRKVREIQTHRREHEEIEKIFYCLSVGNRKRTGYRKILELDVGELERNIFLISERLLEAVVGFESVDKLLYSALRKMLSLRNGVSIYGLISDYFLASILCGGQYEDLGMFLVRHAPAVLLNDRERLASNLPCGELKRRICNLGFPGPQKSIDFRQKVSILREQVLVGTGENTV